MHELVCRINMGVEPLLQIFENYSAGLGEAKIVEFAKSEKVFLYSVENIGSEGLCEHFAQSISRSYDFEGSGFPYRVSIRRLDRLGNLIF